MIRISILFGFLAITLCTTTMEGQTINAASCNASDVQAALNSVVADGTTVVIPSGNCTWTTTVTYNQVYSTTIQGQTSCIGTPASSCTDNTILTDNINRTGSDPGMLVINTASAKSFRLTGITFAQINGTGSSLTYLGTLRLNGTSQAVRVDHCHFNNINQTALTEDSVFGVIDHVVAYIPSEFMRNLMSESDNQGNASWATATQFGTNQFFFLEDSTMTGPPSNSGNGTNDCFTGGKFVVRHNVLDYSSVQGHATGHAGDDRGCRAGEFYDNNITLSNDSGNYWGFNGYFLAGGPAMIWGNTFPSGLNYYTHAVTAHINREDNQTYPQTFPPAGWGYCGTAVQQSNGLTEDSPWDQNSNVPTGYACLDQVGRGVGDLLTGSFPNKVNSAQGGTIAWARQRLEPAYEWGDTWNCTGDQNCSFWSNYDPGIVQNRDYYLGFNNTSCPANPAGNCTAGVGVGTLANRPTSCTTNSVSYPAGNSPGVGYWATDTSTLYVCSATNTWSAYYTPYTYPHPLQGQGGPPGPPSNLLATPQ
jgi:hypothetical protein